MLLDKFRLSLNYLCLAFETVIKVITLRKTSLWGPLCDGFASYQVQKSKKLLFIEECFNFISYFMHKTQGENNKTW